ncbi:MAG: hypothetical protein CH104c_0500 [Candidatus Woesebacteria bacterium]|nr:MAG: hypothetical protein CH104c_0500 [Candidatus Woesebacteria bacterium]
MTDKNEEKLEKGQAVWEMTQTEGWQIIKSQIEAEIAIETNELLDCPVEEVEKLRTAILAYKRVLSMVETAEKEKVEAAEAVRNQ